MGAAQAVVLAVVAEKREVVGAKPAWAHACTFGSPAGTSGKEKGILHSGLERAVLCWKDGDGHVGDASVPSLLLAVHELL